MKEYWKLIKAIFAIKKTLKKEDMKIDLETIRKFWVMLATTGVIKGLNWLPDYIKVLFTEAGTNLTFDTAGILVAAFSAVVGWWQFTTGRTGKDKPLELRAEKSDSASWKYIVLPWKSA